MTVDKKSSLHALLGGASLGVLMIGAFQASAQSIDEVDSSSEKRIVVAQAQTGTQSDASDAGVETVEQIVITGSRIRRSAEDDVLNTVEIGSEEIDLRGFVNTIEGLEQLPFVAVGVNNQGNSTQFGDNNAFVNLLNFGTQRTVTLIDGRRFVSSNQGTVFVPGNATGAQVDLTIVNPSLIERTEVVTVGSGPIYGADAVAGAVNVILKRDFEGLDMVAQGGITDESDGAQGRASIAWGDKILDDRGHLILAAEYLFAKGIYGSDNRRFTNNIGTVNNPFNRTTTDGISSVIFQENQINPTFPVGGRLDLRQLNAGNSATFFFPQNCVGGQTVNVAACNAFATANGASPFDFASANPSLGGLNPLAFVGTFGLTSGMPTIPVAPGSPEALAGLTRIAVPLTFDAQGNPVPFNLGDLLPPNVATQAAIINSGGFDAQHLNTLRAEQERISINAFFSYDLSPTMKYRADFMYSDIDNEQRSDNFQANSPAGTFTAGNGGIPIFFEQNPFVTQATRNQIDSIIAANDTNPFTTIGGAPVFFLQRSLADISGSLAGNVTNREGNRSRTWSTSHSLSDDFELFGRELYWETTFQYSRNRAKNRGANDILDIEFALATDVVQGPNGPVCRQQTLSAPEAVNVRNSFLTNINIATGIIPTQAQIDACQPLNLFGVGQASQAAIDFVTAPSLSENVAEQLYASGQVGGELFELPAGHVRFNSEFQWRREELSFSPGDVFRQGLARATIGQPSQGFARFFEGGTEFSVPVFGDDFRTFLMRELELTGAVRVVNRAGRGTPNGLDNPRVDTRTGSAVTFTAGGRWSPIEDVTFRGNRTRAVRSPSITESLGAPQTGFSGLAGLFPCNGNQRDNGPASGIRITNCDAFEARLGLPAGTFASLFPPGGTVPAGVGGNPNLENEVANNWTVGAVWKPSFIPGLEIISDYVSLRLDKQIGLTFLGTQCFDQETFPESIIGGVNACDSIVLGVGSGATLLDGPFVAPAINSITGNPVAPPTIPGAPTVVQAPFTIATGQFSNANQGSRRLDALNTNIRYSFAMNDLTSGVGLGDLPDLGTVQINGFVYYIRRFQSSSSGTFGDDTNNIDGEVNNEKYQTRLDITHRIGGLTHQLQWFRDHRAVVNVDTPKERIPDQNPNFRRPSFNTFNYNIGYDITENLTARVVVNNFTDAKLLPEFGIAGDVVGRSFLVRLDARF